MKRIKESLQKMPLENLKLRRKIGGSTLSIILHFKQSHKNENAQINALNKSSNLNASSCFYLIFSDAREAPKN
jgi:hypothetical protein